MHEPESVVYKRREWALVGLLGILCVIGVIEVVWGRLALKYIADSGIRGTSAQLLMWKFRILFYGSIFALVFICYGAILIVLTNRELRVYVGFLVKSERIPYNQIYSIRKTNLRTGDVSGRLVLDPGIFLRSFFSRGTDTVHKRYYAAETGPGFCVNRNNGVLYFIQSDHTDEILSVIKEQYPSILIDYNEPEA